MPAARPEKWCGGGGDQQRPAYPRGPGRDGAPPAQAFNQRNRGQLQELHRKWHRSQQADRGIAGTEFYRVTGKEHAGCERRHGFARERVVEHQSERPVGAIRPMRCRRIAVGHFRDFAAHGSSRQLRCRTAQATATGAPSRAERRRSWPRVVKGDSNLEFGSVTAKDGGNSKLGNMLGEELGESELSSLRVHRPALGETSPHRHGRACPGHRSWHSAATDGRDKPGHDGEGAARSEATLGSSPRACAAIIAVRSRMGIASLRSQ